MSIKVGINGFGRIGRLVFRAMQLHPELKIVAIHDLYDPKILVNLLLHDSTHGKAKFNVTAEGDMILLEGRDQIKVLKEKVGPGGIDWGCEVDLVVESTGIFRSRAKGNVEGFDSHLGRNGCKKVILTVPPKDEIDATIVMGVNDQTLKPEHNCVSNASCTTNCLAPVVKVLNENFRIVEGLLNTIHAFTNDQVVLDMAHKDPRRARGAFQNIIPTSTGAAKAIGLVIPELSGKLDGFATRVPVANVSMIDLTVLVEKETTKEEINDAIREAGNTSLAGFLQYSEESLVSSDIIGNPHSAVFDSGMTMVLNKRGNFFKVVAWYDNEWGYSCRVADLAKKLFSFPTSVKL